MKMYSKLSPTLNRVVDCPLISMTTGLLASTSLYIKCYTCVVTHKQIILSMTSYEH